MSEHNKSVGRRLIAEVWNRGNFALIDELVASDFLGHSTNPAEEGHGPEDYKQFHSTLRQAFPDLQYTVEDQVAEGDRVVTR